MTFKQRCLACDEDDRYPHTCHHGVEEERSVAGNSTIVGHGIAEGDWVRRITGTKRGAWRSTCKEKEVDIDGAFKVSEVIGDYLKLTAFGDRRWRASWFNAAEVSPQVHDQESGLPSIDQNVNHPKHYVVLDDLEAIEIIARSMTVEMFKGYCLGNLLKYRLRLGAKDAVEQDLKKAQKYTEIFDKFKGLCHA